MKTTSHFRKAKLKRLTTVLAHLTLLSFKNIQLEQYLLYILSG